MAIEIPPSHDALKLARAQLRYVEEVYKRWVRFAIYVLLIVYLLVLIAYSIFVMTAFWRTAQGAWKIPWHTLASMGSSNAGLGAAAYFFRTPMIELFRRRQS